MTSFFLDILHGETLLLRSLLGMALASIASGIVGSYVVLRRESYTVGAVSHSLLGGVGFALWAAIRHPSCAVWLTPWLGALLSALLAATLITLLTVRWKMRMDTVLSALWALGMAIGLSFATAMPGYPPDLNSYLFGNILILSRMDLLLAAVLDIAILLLACLWHTRFVTLAFHEELLTLRGVRIGAVQFALQLMIAMTVVVLSQMVGLVLCMALLILPVATATLLCRSILRIMLTAALLCFLALFLGTALSYEQLPNGVLLSPSATMIELAGGGYLLVSALRWLRKRKRE